MARYDGEDQYFGMCRRCNGHARLGREICDRCSLSASAPLPQEKENGGESERAKDCGHGESSRLQDDPERTD